MNKKITKILKKKSFYIGILLTIIVLFILKYVIMFCLFFYLVFTSGQKETEIAKDFKKEISQTHGLKVNKFYTFDDDGWADLEVINRGKVSIFYSGYQKISFRRIENYSMTFPCILIYKNNNQIGYAGGSSTWLYKGSPYLKWFPQIDNLQDLVNKYDEIIKSLERLPKNPKLVEYTDPKWKDKRYTLTNHNENFRVYHKTSYLLYPINAILGNAILGVNPFATKASKACDLFTGLQYIPE